MDRYTLQIEMATRRESNVVFCNHTAIEHTGLGPLDALEPWSPSASAGRVPASSLAQSGWQNCDGGGGSKGENGWERWSDSGRLRIEQTEVFSNPELAQNKH